MIPSDTELVRSAQAGEIKARNALVERHMGFIFCAVRSSIGPKRPIYEYIGVGVEAFIKAIALYDPKHNAKLTTYAKTGIRRSCWIEMNRDRLIRVPKEWARAPHKESIRKATACGLHANSTTRKKVDRDPTIGLQLAELGEQVHSLGLHHAYRQCRGESLDTIAESSDMCRESIRKNIARSLSNARQVFDIKRL